MAMFRNQLADSLSSLWGRWVLATVAMPGQGLQAAAAASPRCCRRAPVAAALPMLQPHPPSSRKAGAGLNPASPDEPTSFLWELCLGYTAWGAGAPPELESGCREVSETGIALVSCHPLSLVHRSCCSLDSAMEGLMFSLFIC